MAATREDAAEVGEDLEDRSRVSEPTANWMLLVERLDRPVVRRLPPRRRPEAFEVVTVLPKPTAASAVATPKTTTVRRCAPRTEMCL